MPWTMAAKSLRLGDFTEAETRALLAQHTEETGQAFTADARAAVWTRTAGQPWLVNALCREACFENQTGRDRSRAITEGDILVRWAGVDLRADDDVVVTVRRSKTDPTGGRADVRRPVGGCAAAARSLHAAVSPEPGDSVAGFGVDQISRRFAAALRRGPASRGGGTSHGGRVGLAVELTARGASTHAIQLAGRWKDLAMVGRYAAAVASRESGRSR